MHRSSWGAPPYLLPRKPSYDERLDDMLKRLDRLDRRAGDLMESLHSSQVVDFDGGIVTNRRIALKRSALDRYLADEITVAEFDVLRGAELGLKKDEPAAAEFLSKLD
jgi:hypothetical protein